MEGEYSLSGGFRGGRAAPFLGRRTDAVTVLLISENGTVLWRVINFNRVAVTHALQNIQSDCHQTSFLTALEGTKFVFGRRSAQNPAGGAYSAPQIPS